jgi:predicted nucleotidyltransferase component of viral defense system
MNEAVKTMLSKYKCQSSLDYENALKEIMQEIALLGLWRAKFFERAAFYGGSALRILYGIDRFSEDLDFSLLKKDKKFSLNDSYMSMIEGELKSFGFSVSIEKRIKVQDSNIDSAFIPHPAPLGAGGIPPTLAEENGNNSLGSCGFIKAGTLQNLILVDAPEFVRGKTHAKSRIKIKLEVDIDPPLGFETEARFLLLPISFSVVTYMQPDLFAGKLHAVLCRSWKTRVKGRDWYDMSWYVSRDIPCRLKHLESRMRQTEHYNNKKVLSALMVKDMLHEKLGAIDLDQAKRDVDIFVKNRSSLDVWSKKYFEEIINRMKFE